MVMIIDFHTHILPGMDDGSHDLAMTEQLLTDAQEQGVDLVIAAPHFYADSMSIDSFLQRRNGACNLLYNAGLRVPVRILVGAEVAFFHDMAKAEGLERLCIEHTTLMLLEMPFRQWTGRDLLEVEQLINRGIVPIIAHLERFYPLQKNRRIFDALLDLPVYIQINAGSLLHFYTRRVPLKLFAEGRAQFLGSDCHHPQNRPQNLQKARAVLEKKQGKDLLDAIDRLGTELLADVFEQNTVFAYHKEDRLDR